VGGTTGFAVVILAVIVVLSLVALAFYSVKKATRDGGKTWISVRAAGVVLEFGTEINGSSSQGDRSADTGRVITGVQVQEQLKTELLPLREELPPGRRRRWRWPRKRAPSGGES
jgi:hypothetical protein